MASEQLTSDGIKDWIDGVNDQILTLTQVYIFCCLIGTVLCWLCWLNFKQTNNGKDEEIKELKSKQRKMEKQFDTERKRYKALLSAKDDKLMSLSQIQWVVS